MTMPLRAEHTDAQYVESDLRDVAARFASGITAITSMADGRPVGFTCQSFSSLSLLPPLVLFCPSRTSTSWQAIRRAGFFAVNVLDEAQQQVSTVLAQRRDDKFAGLAWAAGATGAPCLDGALAHLDCELERVVDGGDHEIAIGRVVRATHRATGRPLLYYRSTYQTLAW